MCAYHQIFIADSDPSKGQILADQLARTQGFKTSSIERLEEIKVEHYPRDAALFLLIQTYMVSAETIDHLNTWRQQGVKLRCIVLGSSESMLNLDEYVDDHHGHKTFYDAQIITPVRLRTLITQLREFIERTVSGDHMHDDIHFGSLILRAASRQFVTATGEIIRLTEKECGIVRFLYHNRPNVVTRHDLLSQVWGYNTNVTTHTLETHIYRLRQKLELDPTSARLLVTESGGYRLDI